jgi:hypothetical protein
MGRSRPDLSGDVEAVPIGQLEIGDENVWSHGPANFDGLTACVDHADLMAESRHRLLKKGPHSWVAVRDDDV